MPPRTSTGIQVISRASAILREVAANPDGLSLGQLAQATGLARSTVQRIVDALEVEYFVQAGAGGVRPGWGLRRQGELAGPGAARELRPQLYRLFESTHETVDLSTLTGSEVLFMDRFLSDQRIRAVPEIGLHYPAYTMANGKALLAGLDNNEVLALYGQGVLKRMTPKSLVDFNQLVKQLDEIRSGGFAYDVEEHALGSCAIGISVCTNPSSRLAISVVVPTERFELQREIIEQALRLCAEECRARLQQILPNQ